MQRRFFGTAAKGANISSTEMTLFELLETAEHPKFKQIAKLIERRALSPLSAIFCHLPSNQCKAIRRKSSKFTSQSPFTSPATIVSHSGSPKYDLLASVVPP